MIPDDDLEEEVVEETDTTPTEKQHRHRIRSQQVIREFLLRQKDGQASIWDCYCACRDYYTSQSPRLRAPKYTSIRVIIHVLRKFGAIEDVGEEEPSKKWIMHKKKIIRIVEDKIDDDIWVDLWKYYELMRHSEGR